MRYHQAFVGRPRRWVALGVFVAAFLFVPGPTVQAAGDSGGKGMSKEQPAKKKKAPRDVGEFSSRPSEQKGGAARDVGEFSGKPGEPKAGSGTRDVGEFSGGPKPAPEAAGQ